MNLPFSRVYLISISFVMLAFGTSVLGQAEATHTIDAAEANCLKTARGTMPRAKCYSDAADAWEKDVTDTYAKLLKAADENDKKKFAVAQTAWEGYRDAEFELISNIYGRKKGSGYIIVRITLRSAIVRARALRLENWLGAFNQVE